ncbi:TRAP transporter fused permease subunit [Thalassobaculum sp. OXR-137]|uniref:TRAP transporter permease n=1 Tax=Thalassobaculum sp. OXR-137 TaxID=3100173 RepID=UPI002AC90C8E|nr:TRAP transporter fused permease subunit [Thalassobaculum sp. OXR-137]WPZ35980.1 TRAP transporter fused permease subunit [Thalassobaculum sp. OXR-137]
MTQTDQTHRRFEDIAGAADTRSRTATGLLLVAALVMLGIHFMQMATYTLPSGQFRNFHLGFAMLLGFLALIEQTAPERKLLRGLFWALSALTVALVAYIHVEYEALTQVRSFLPNAQDVAVGVLLLVAALILSGFQWGWTIPALALIGIAYGLWGYLLPGEIFFHGGIAPKRLLGYTSIPYFQGLLGGLTSLSAGTIFMFMLFGGALKATGAVDFIVQLGFTVGRKSRAGPALVAVISSGLMGTVSGSTVANVASTGALTIPLMKRYGFKGEFAGAVEAVASTGGQLMPPVMGLAAFLIVGMTGLPYNSIMVAAIAPALIYYAYLMFSVQLRAINLDLDARESDVLDGGPTLAQAAKRQWHLAVSVFVLVWLLVGGMPAGTAALISVLLLLGLDALITVVIGRFGFAAFREALGRVVNGLVEGARAGAAVATVIAVIGVLIELLTVTGFAQKLSFAMLDLSDGSLFTLSIIVAVSCLVFGLGLPTSASYFIVALFGAPALVETGVPLLAAHMFVFYFANLSAVTPPVAVAALVGANIAKAKFWGTAFNAVRLALPGFLMPFLFLFEPEILGIGGDLGAQLVAVGQALIATGALNCALEGRIFQRISILERVILAVAALGLLYWNVQIEMVSLAVVIALAAWNWWRARAARAAA